MEICNLICFVTIIIIGVYSFFIFPNVLFSENTNIIAKIIIKSIFLCLALLTNICEIIEIALNNSLFELIGYFPDYLLNKVDEMKNNVDMDIFSLFCLYQLLILFISLYLLVNVTKKRAKVMEKFYLS